MIVIFGGVGAELWGQINRTLPQALQGLQHPQSAARRARPRAKDSGRGHPEGFTDLTTTGWGLYPLEKRRLTTAHPDNGPSWLLSQTRNCQQVLSPIAWRANEAKNFSLESVF